MKVNALLTWRSAVSLETSEKLCFPQDSLVQLLGCSMKVSTAEEGSELQALGELPDPIQMVLPESNQIYGFWPIVIGNLTIVVNHSGPWLKKHGWN